MPQLNDGMKKAAFRPPASLTAILGLAVGLAGGYVAGTQQPKKSYDAGYLAAKNELQQKLNTGGRTSAQRLAVMRLSGRVKEKGTDRLVLENVPQLNPDPLGEPTPAVRTVLVTAETKIMLTKEKDPETYRKELEAYAAASQPPAREPEDGAPQPREPLAEPPSPTIEETVTLDDVVVGMTVTVDAATDIMSAASFTATAVHISNLPVKALPSPEVFKDATPVPDDKMPPLPPPRTEPEPDQPRDLH